MTAIERHALSRRDRRRQYVRRARVPQIQERRVRWPEQQAAAQPDHPACLRQGTQPQQLIQTGAKLIACPIPQCYFKTRKVLYFLYGYARIFRIRTKPAMNTLPAQRGISFNHARVPFPAGRRAAAPLSHRQGSPSPGPSRGSGCQCGHGHPPAGPGRYIPQTADLRWPM